MQVSDHILQQSPALEDQTLNILRFDQSTGGEAVFLGGSYDNEKPVWEEDVALLNVLAFQQWAPSRGRTRWGYGGDAPLTRVIAYHAIGQSALDTIELNSPLCTDLETPLWEMKNEEYHKATQHYGQDVQTRPSTPVNLCLHPWSALHLHLEGHKATQICYAALQVKTKLLLLICLITLSAENYDKL